MDDLFTIDQKTKLRLEKLIRIFKRSHGEFKKLPAKKYQLIL